MARFVAAGVVFLLASLSACGEYGTSTAPKVLAPTDARKVIVSGTYFCNGDGWEINAYAFDCKDVEDVHIAFLGNVNMKAYCDENADDCHFFTTGFPSEPYANPLYIAPVQRGRFGQC